MAIAKTIKTNYGIDATYWNIQKIEWHKSGECVVSLYGFQNEDARKAGRAPLATRVALLSSISFSSKEAVLPTVYDKIVVSNKVEAEDGALVEINEFEGGVAC
jgi:hypothetical protein